MITIVDKKVIGYITKYYSDTGFYPDYEEIAEGMGWTSKSTVALHMKKLEEEGIIIRKEYCSAQYRLANIDFRLRKNQIAEQIGGKE